MSNKKRRNRNKRQQQAQQGSNLPSGLPAARTPEPVSLDPQPVMRQVQTAKIAQMEMKVEQYKGHLPPPGFLNDYNDAIPNGGERVFELIEREAAHIQSQERKMLDAQIKLLGRGQIFAVVVALGSLVAAGVIAPYSPVVAGMALTAGIGTLAVAFLGGKVATGKSGENTSPKDKKQDGK